MKKIMMLGGNYFQMSATKLAKKMGYYVISCDYLPDNPAHKYADEYHNVSTIDKEAVLELASHLKIDGIMSYASDVSAETVSYVAEKLHLPCNPLSAIKILTNKHEFRKFLISNGFNCPVSKSFQESELEDYIEYVGLCKFPVMVKPVDSSGSKGLTKLESIQNAKEAFKFAQSFSKNKILVVEDYIERMGIQLEIEGFLVDGKIKFCCAMDQHCDEECTKFSPIGSSVPTTQDPSIQKKAKEDAQKIFDLLGMKFGSFNYEYIVDKAGDLYIMEIGPRNGGNFIPDMINYSQGIDLAEYTIRATLGEDCSDISNRKVSRCVSYYLLHSPRDGSFDGVWMSDEIKGRILKEYIYVKKGDKVKKFVDGRMGLGVFIIEFDNLNQKTEMMKNMNSHIRVLLTVEGDL